MRSLMSRVRIRVRVRVRVRVWVRVRVRVRVGVRSIPEADVGRRRGRPRAAHDTWLGLGIGS